MVKSEIILPKKHLKPLDQIKKWLGLLLIALLLLSVGFCILPFVIPEILGSISVAQANYPEAGLIYSGYRNVGSSPWQLKSFVYWTNDSTDAVKKYYERQVAIESFEQQVNKAPTISAFKGQSDRLLIVFANANQIHLGNLLDQYEDDPYSKIDKLPKSGTLIILTYDIYVP